MKRYLLELIGGIGGGIALIFVCKANAADIASTLPPDVTSPWLVAAVIIAVVLVGGYFLLRKYDPTLLAKVIATGSTDAAALKTSLENGLAKIEAAIKSHTAAVAPTPVTIAAAAAPAAPPGKNGVAGTFVVSVTVTGNPATDIAAINAATSAAYFS